MRSSRGVRQVEKVLRAVGVQHAVYVSRVVVAATVVGVVVVVVVVREGGESGQIGGRVVQEELAVELIERLEVAHIAAVGDHRLVNELLLLLLMVVLSTR